MVVSWATYTFDCCIIELASRARFAFFGVGFYTSLNVFESFVFNREALVIVALNTIKMNSILFPWIYFVLHLNQR